MEKPINYDYMNLYNSQRSPSTVHVKNVRLQRFFRKYLLQKAISVFKWELPETWDKDYFLYTLYCRGFICIMNTPRWGVICQECSPGGYNLYYRPSYVIVTNPLFKKTYTLNIDIDCTVVRLQPDWSSVLDLVNYYADILALGAEATGANLLNVKSGTVFGAEKDAQAQTFYKMFDSLTAGNPAVAVGKNMFDAEGKPTWFPFTQNLQQQYVTSDLLADMRTVEQMFDTEIGIPNSNLQKRERMLTDEINANNAETGTRGELWLETVRKEFDKANKMFEGLNLSVDWRVNPNAEPAPIEGSDNDEPRS